MQLDRVAVALRPRTPWEAMDLGFAMARLWWRPIWRAWCAVYLPVALILHLAFSGNLLIVSLLLWWLKPVFDRVVLQVLSGAVFGAPTRVRDTLRSLRVALSPGLILSLTLYRFDLARSFNLPIWQLERAQGKVARQRARILHRRARGHAVWLTVICLHFELIILLSLVMLIDMLTPGPYQLDIGWSALFSGGHTAPPWQDWSNNLFYVVAVSLIEPFYVAAGFALYLNRRTQLEAWDIELALHRLNQPTGRRLAAVAGVAWALVCGMLLWHAPTVAEAADAPPKSARAEIVEVLKDPAFDRHKDVKVWRYTGRGLGIGESGDQRDSRRDWTNLGQFLADVGRAIMWVGAASLIAWLLWLALRYGRRWYAQQQAAYRPPDALFGFDIRPESLPADVAATALALCAEQRLREALSLLYRGALSRLVYQLHFQLNAGDTEQDCLRRVVALGEAPTAGYFAHLVTAWQLVAYAGRMPPPGAAERLCHDWRQHFVTGTAP